MNKPFLKWLGGKTRLVRQIKRILPKGRRFIEPFVGSGAVFLNVDFEEYLLADSNNDLIKLYSNIHYRGRQFVDQCKIYFTTKNNDKDEYLKLRKMFNETKDPSIFPYLNRHCFNGLCRYNSKGEFNTPFGEYDNPVHFPYKEMLTFAEKCRTKKVEFVHADFRETFKNVKRGDVIYCDPPYVPLSATSSFTSYDSDGFSAKDQEDLANLASQVNVPVIISNHDTEYTRQLYNKASYIEKIHVGRFVGGDRKSVEEILVLFNGEYKPKHLWNT